MKTIRNPTIALLMFVVLISVVVSWNNYTESNFTVSDSDIKDGYDVGNALSNIRILQGINDTSNAFQTMTTPTGNPVDLLGALASGGLGVLKTITGIITFPYEIISVVGKYYAIPSIFITIIQIAMTILVGFILLSAYLKQDI